MEKQHTIIHFDMSTKKQSAGQLYKKLSYGYHKEVFSYCDEMGFEKKVLQNSLGNIVDTCYKIGKSFLVIRLENGEPSEWMETKNDLSFDTFLPWLSMYIN